MQRHILSIQDVFQFWADVIKLTSDKMAKMNDKSGNLAEKIALFDCNIWPKGVRNNEFNVACHHRKIGNEYYNNQQFENAIEAYNALLCSSTSLVIRGVAYANRSAAFLALSRYQDCLESVRLAKECCLLENTMKKVLAREKMAIEGLELEQNTSGDSDMPVELSYRRNKHVPSFAFCMNLKDADNPYGGIVTTENLLPGDILVLEPPLTRCTRLRSMCNYCFRKCGSLQPCDCANVMFCSPKCKEAAFEEYHNYECPLMDFLVVFPYLDCVVLRVFFKLIQRFKDVASLREYLENIKNPNPFKDDDFEEWSNPGSFESQFRLYYATERPSTINCTVQKNNLFRTDLNNKVMITAMSKTAIIINMLKTCKQIPHSANNDEEWSFLSEVLFRLIFCKSFAILSVSELKDIKYVEDDNIEIIMKADPNREVTVLHGYASLFRTSCQPNVEMIYQENNITVRALKYIPRGTELLAPYYVSILNAYSLKAWFPSKIFDLTRACYCAQCQQWCDFMSHMFELMF